jgi:hypothetical protein
MRPPLSFVIPLGNGSPKQDVEESGVRRSYKRF